MYVRFAGKFEWFTLWLLTADHRGLVTKEAVRAVYDGSVFYMMERKWSKGETVRMYVDDSAWVDVAFVNLSPAMHR